MNFELKEMPTDFIQRRLCEMSDMSEMPEFFIESDCFECFVRLMQKLVKLLCDCVASIASLFQEMSDIQDGISERADILDHEYCPSVLRAKMICDDVMSN